jgi:hypothetical protein
MTDIEAKALALVNEIRREYPNAADYTASHIALCRAIEQHEAFKQEVSDTVHAFVYESGTTDFWEKLNSFIIHKPKPKPDPLLDIVEWLGGEWEPEEYVKEIRAALDARGLEIREKGQ